jgi:hypothetical protein
MIADRHPLPDQAHSNCHITYVHPSGSKSGESTIELLAYSRVCH